MSFGKKPKAPKPSAQELAAPLGTPKTEKDA